jgi:hypothetical protein
VRCALIPEYDALHYLGRVVSDRTNRRGLDQKTKISETQFDIRQSGVASGK